MLVRYVNEFLTCLPKGYISALCSKFLQVIKEKILLVRYVQEFLLCLPKDYTCAICSIQGLLDLDGRNSQKYLHQTWAYFSTLIMLHKLTQIL